MNRLANLSPAQWAGQIVFYILVVAGVGYFADSPAYHYVEPGNAELKLVVRYSGKLLGECRQLGGKELDKLAPNMRAAEVCPREKSPVQLEMAIDENVVFEQTVHPSGLHEDGIIALYKRFTFDAGKKHLRLRVRDDIRQDDYSHTLEREVELDPDRILVVEFDDDGFQLIQPREGQKKAG